jgi:hypothetical protein
MTITRQDILEEFYSGNTKNIRLTVRDATGQNFSLTGCEVTYAISDDSDTVHVRKNSVDSSQIEIQNPPNSHICIIRLLPNDTAKLNGLFRYTTNVVNQTGEEETVMTGTIRIHKTYAFRYRSSSRQAYTVGV